ncbi:MAG: hypothetical protein M1826_007434 [Phylliscum demangeonii]|nr:MAG: hypothetical protein M1826_007434 [Phylliscum demangeonii]
MPSTPAPPVITVSLQDLEANSVPFHTLEAAFGTTSLGILLVHGLPAQYLDLRGRVLGYASLLANLPADELAKLECAEAKWLVGWSRGRETLKNGVYDRLKGSFYVNCAFYQREKRRKDAGGQWLTSEIDARQNPSLNQATTSAHHPSAFPEYTTPNRWSAESVLAGFRPDVTALCTLMIDTAVLVARACDRYAEATVDRYPARCLEQMVRRSTTTKARLLHYFPPPAPPERTTDDDDADDEDDDSWCATHLDHGCLTALTSALWVDESTRPLRETTAPCSSGSSAAAGLYIRSRTGATVPITIPPDQLAFQTGEALQILTRGHFHAVSHFVKAYHHHHQPHAAGTGTAAPQIARNTLAVFTQPNLDDMIDEDRDFATFARDIVAGNL